MRTVSFRLICVYARVVTEGVYLYEIVSVPDQITCVLVGGMVTLLSIEIQILLYPKRHVLVLLCSKSLLS